MWTSIATTVIPVAAAAMINGANQGQGGGVAFAVCAVRVGGVA